MFNNKLKNILNVLSPTLPVLAVTFLSFGPLPLEWVTLRFSYRAELAVSRLHGYPRSF